MIPILVNFDYRYFVKLFAFIAICALSDPLSATDSSPTAPVAKGIREIGMSVNQSENGDYNDAIAKAVTVGMHVVSLKLNWDEMEKKPGVFESHRPKIANAYYPARNLQISLRLATLDTSQNRIPSDLSGKAFSDPAVIGRFNNFLDYVLNQMPDVKIAELSVGNEVDCLLGTDAAKWKQYGEFFEAVKEHLQQHRPGVKAGVSITFQGHMGKAAGFCTAINKEADVVMVSYYPLTPDFKARDPKVVREDFNAICQRYPGRSISFVEAGFPSGSVCGSSEVLQAQFYSELFRAWDEHAEQIQRITFVWLHDIAPGSVQGYRQYYQVAIPAFSDYLATLGLRTFKGAGSDACVCNPASAGPCSRVVVAYPRQHAELAKPTVATEWLGAAARPFHKASGYNAAHLHDLRGCLPLPTPALCLG